MGGHAVACHASAATCFAITWARSARPRRNSTPAQISAAILALPAGRSAAGRATKLRTADGLGDRPPGPHPPAYSARQTCPGYFTSQSLWRSAIGRHCAADAAAAAGACSTLRSRAARPP